MCLCCTICEPIWKSFFLFWWDNCWENSNRRASIIRLPFSCHALSMKNCNVALSDVLHRFLWLLNTVVQSYSCAEMHWHELKIGCQVLFLTCWVFIFFTWVFFSQANISDKLFITLSVSFRLQRENDSKEWNTAETYHVWKPLLFHVYWSHEKVCCQKAQVDEKRGFPYDCMLPNKYSLVEAG